MCHFEPPYRSKYLQRSMLLHSAGLNVRFLRFSALLLDDPVRELGRGVCQCVRQCVGLCPMQMRWKGSFFWLATKQQAPSCACDPCARQDPLRLPTATSLGAASSSKCYRSQSGQTVARICSTPTKTKRGIYEILHSCPPLYDTSAKPNTRKPPASRSRNASSSEPPRRRAVQLRQVYAPSGPPSALTLAALAGRNCTLHGQQQLTRAQSRWAP